METLQREYIMSTTFFLGYKIETYGFPRYVPARIAKNSKPLDSSPGRM
jgi:hypothetical protein